MGLAGMLRFNYGVKVLLIENPTAWYPVNNGCITVRLQQEEANEVQIIDMKGLERINGFECKLYGTYEHQVSL